MGATYNASVANLVDPLSNSPLNSPSHSNQHTEINDALQTLGIWISYTPTHSNLTVGNGTQVFNYVQFNKTVFVSGFFAFGSTTTLAGDWTISLPITAASGSDFTGSILILDSGTRLYTGSVYANGTASFQICHSESGNFGTVNGTNPMTWAVNDQLRVSITYRAA